MSTTRRRRPGFTLIELAVVVGMLSILTGATVVAFSAYKRHAQLAEPIGNVHAIYSLQLAHPVGPIACAPSPSEVPRATTSSWESTGGFREIGFSPGELTRFQYEVVVDGDAFVVRARGDLDGDGVTSLIELRSDQPDLRVEGAVE